MCCSSGGGVPPPDPNEAKLSALELKNAMRASDLNEKMFPFIMESMGLEEHTLDPSEAWTSAKGELDALRLDQFEDISGDEYVSNLATGRNSARNRRQDDRRRNAWNRKHPSSTAQEQFDKKRGDIQSFLDTNAPGTEFRKKEDPEADARNATRLQIEDAGNERTLKALKGELDVDPSVTKDIDRGRAELTEKLFRALGPGSEGSTAWNRAVAEYDRQSNALKYSIRHGEMTSADAVATNRQNIATRNQNQMFNQMQGSQTPFVSAANVANQGAGRLQSGRLDTARINTSAANAKNAMIGSAISGVMGAAGTIGGAAMMPRPKTP